MNLEEIKVSDLVEIETRYKKYFGILVNIKVRRNYVFLKVLKETSIHNIDINIDKIKLFNLIKIVSL